MPRKTASVAPCSSVKSAPPATKVSVGSTSRPKGKPAKPSKTVSLAAPSIEQISVRAYEIWLRKGRPIGRDQDNWLEAEAELKFKA